MTLSELWDNDSYAAGILDEDRSSDDERIKSGNHIKFKPKNNSFL
jgi:hypothetical protein